MARRCDTDGDTMRYQGIQVEESRARRHEMLKWNSKNSTAKNCSQRHRSYFDGQGPLPGCMCACVCHCHVGARLTRHLEQLGTGLQNCITPSQLESRHWPGPDTRVLLGA